MRVTLKSTPEKEKHIDLNKVSFKNRIVAGIVNWDNLMLSMKVVSRVEGNYVTFKVHIPKDQTIFTLKLKVSTFLKVFAKFKAIHDKIVKEAEKTV